MEYAFHFIHTHEIVHINLGRLTWKEKINELGLIF